MAKAQVHTQTEVSPAVAMLVVILVLSMAVGILMYSLEHSSAGIIEPEIRSGHTSEMPHGAAATQSKPAPTVDHESGKPASQKR